MPPIEDAVPAREPVPAADVEVTVACRRSLQASRARRVTAVRRRRLVRGRGAIFAATGLLAIASGGAIAQQSASVTGGTPATMDSVIADVQRALGVPADGVAGPVTRAAIRRFQRAHGLKADGILGPRTLRALGISVGSTGMARAAAVGVDIATWSTLQRIARCESGGNPRAVSATGIYRGKYQFSRTTWRELGGKGDPARAPESVQDRLAAKLLLLAGLSAWPNCA